MSPPFCFSVFLLPLSLLPLPHLPCHPLHTLLPAGEEKKHTHTHTHTPCHSIKFCPVVIVHKTASVADCIVLNARVIFWFQLVFFSQHLFYSVSQVCTFNFSIAPDHSNLAPEFCIAPDHSKSSTRIL